MKAILFIDPICSGNYQIQEFKNLGFKTIIAKYLKNCDEKIIENSLPYGKADYVLHFSGSLREDIAIVHTLMFEQKLELKMVIPGTELTLAYADQIAFSLIPQYANNPKTSVLRYNKAAMHERLTAYHLSCARQWQIKTTNDLKQLKDEDYPVVIKPAFGGGGSNGVKICDSETELLNVMKHYTEFKSSYGGTLGHFLIEEFLRGEEFFVDAVSLKNTHLVNGVYHYRKKVINGTPVCQIIEFTRDHPALNEIIAYVKEVLRVCDYQFGLSHTEVIVTSTGPKLIELNPRISGCHGYVNKLGQLITGYNQPMLLTAMLNKQNITPKLEGYGLLYLVQNYGFHYSSIATENLDELSSYVDYHILIPTAEKAPTVIALQDTVMIVLLHNTHQEALEEDISILQKLEHCGILFKR